MIEYKSIKVGIYMKIQAYHKIFAYLSNEILENNLGTNKEPITRKITDVKELEEILKQANGIDLNLLNSFGTVKEVRAEEWFYENGLKYIICEMDYSKNKDEDEIQTIEKRILTANFLSNPIMMLDFTRNRVAPEQFLAPKSTSSILFPKEERTIEINEMTVSLNGLCTGCFKEIKNLKTNQLLKEEYLQYYPIIKGTGFSKKFINLCGCGERKLELLYHNDNPVFADFSGKHTIEMIGLQANKKEDIQKIIALINEEVEAITQKISSSIKIYRKQNQPKIRSRKKEDKNTD